MLPVEKMAVRVLCKNGLIPPYCLEDLVSHYADVEYRLFPFEADGITVGIGGDSKPQIIINKAIPATRKKFTLAHELGHIIIPWHTGTIVSHIEYDINAQLDYREMETEANRFAAELLLPSSWLESKFNEYESYADYLNCILNTTDASRDAVLIKVFKVIKEPVICIQLGKDGEAVNLYRTSTAPHATIYDINEKFIFHTSNKTEIFSLGDRDYRLLLFEGEVIEESDKRSWRDILNDILLDTGCQHLQKSINATLPTRFHSNKNKSVNEICNAVLRHFDGKEKFDKIIVHPLFTQYVIKRVKELVDRYKA